MVDARSKLDILYNDVLGDIHEIINHIESLKATIPSAADQAAKKIELQTGTMLAAANKLRGELADITRQIDSYADTATKKAVDVGIQDMRQAAVEAMHETIGTEIFAIVGHITQAAKRLDNEAERTRNSITAASQQISWGWKKKVFAMFGASVAGALLVFSALQLTGLINVKPAQLSKEDRQTLQNGKTLETIWNDLTQEERDHINELARATKR